MPLLPFLLALSVTGLLTSCASLNSAGVPATPITTPPAACLTYCQPPPTRTNPRPIWEQQIEDWSDQCLQLHAACADWSRRQIRNP